MAGGICYEHTVRQEINGFLKVAADILLVCRTHKYIHSRQITSPRRVMHYQSAGGLFRSLLLFDLRITVAEETGGGQGEELVVVR